jgi:hypothetical protein
MQTTQASMLQSLRAVKAFLEANADKLSGVLKSGYRQKLDDAIGALSAHASTQVGSLTDAKVSTRVQRALRTRLIRDHMSPIARIAQAELRSAKGIEALRMPKPRLGTEKLAAAAGGMGETAAQYAAVFIAGGLPADFIAQLNAAAGAMVATIDTRAQKQGNQTGATKGLKARLSEGRKCVRVLDALVQSALADDDALLANWNRIKRVRLVASRPASRSAPDSTPAANPTH